MAIFLVHSRYRRTCNICGDRWIVTRRQAVGSPGRMRRPRRTHDRGNFRTFDIQASTAAFDAAVEVWQAYRRCPHCGIDDFAQRPSSASSTD